MPTVRWPVVNGLAFLLPVRTRGNVPVRAQRVPGELNGLQVAAFIFQHVAIMADRCSTSPRAAFPYQSQLHAAQPKRAATISTQFVFADAVRFPIETRLVCASSMKLIL
jgi:hypothetical protein